MSFTEILTDPEGRRVLWSLQRWERHVVRKRSFLAGQEWMAMQTVEMADIITIDADFRNRLCYYKRGIDPDSPPSDYFKVVVDFQEDPAEGVFITGFPTTQVKPGEVSTWQRH